MKINVGEIRHGKHCFVSGNTMDKDKRDGD